MTDKNSLEEQNTRSGKRKIFSYVIVFFQMLLIALIIAVTYNNSLSFIPIMLIVLSLLPGIAGMITLKLRFNLIPEPREGSLFIDKGIYKFIRHPMYTSVLLSMLVLTFFSFSIISVFLWIMLLITLLIKTKREENFLKEKFPEYMPYSEKTKALIPFIY